ncbi:MazG-like family protein [Ligilactobacillus equi]|uniref:Uncharacterized protein n=1 Tax=Ligilactobacillus equi DSM 15833 = JCM 10991 TaxID=1423740 RepID=A0A0R1TA14_9LACO|nr:MazG-like family protein [Ligilactobacillus equi]KRL78253.1 hypothetical protein FC36_GL001142 [Ligilactobacillus equi DSM 15833 = JCM 10991]
MQNTKDFINNVVTTDIKPNQKHWIVDKQRFNFVVDNMSEEEWQAEHLTVYTLQKVKKEIDLHGYDLKLSVEEMANSLVVDICFRPKEEELTLPQLVGKLKVWAEERGLLTANPEVQFTKIYEELGETATAMNKNWHDELIDSIGDLQVTIIIFAHQMNIDLLREIDNAKLVKDKPSNSKHEAFTKIGIELGKVAEYAFDGLYKPVEYHLAKAFLKVQHFSLRCNLDATDCLNKAYNTIANRGGKTINGTFVKEEDLR